MQVRVKAWRGGRSIVVGWVRRLTTGFSEFCRFVRSGRFTIVQLASVPDGSVIARYEVSAVSDGVNDSWCILAGQCGQRGARACPLWALPALPVVSVGVGAGGIAPRLE